MTFTSRKTRAVLLTLCVLICMGATAARLADTLPARLSDGAFWDLVQNLSEPSGTFSSENVLSNESGFSFAIPEIQRQSGADGVYLGVGPEQNFNYIAALRPPIAFIIDIRRQNLVEHLFYKALFEMSANRIDFVSRLFSRTPPVGLSPQSTARELFGGFADAPVDEAVFKTNLETARTLLIEQHKFNLTAEDLQAIEHLYQVFRDFGPEIDYNATGRMVGGRTDPMPTYAALMLEAGDDGKERSYLSNEENYQIVRAMESRNLIVPLVGDFAGPKTVRAVGQYVKDHSATVSVFYVSNVEAYLFPGSSPFNPNGGAAPFYNNVRALPLAPSSIFVRSIPLRNARGGVTGWQSIVTAPMQQTIKDLDNGLLNRYGDLYLPRR